MTKGTAAFIGGLIGGFIKLSIDQLAFESNISSINTAGMFSSYLFGTSANLLTWILYILAVGVIGWLISFLISDALYINFLTYGLMIGILWWAAMNVLIAIIGISTPTWLLGTGSLIVSIISHLALGVIIVYTILRLRTKDVE